MTEVATISAFLEFAGTDDVFLLQQGIRLRALIGMLISALAFAAKYNDI